MNVADIIYLTVLGVIYILGLAAVYTLISYVVLRKRFKKQKESGYNLPPEIPRTPKRPPKAPPRPENPDPIQYTHNDYF